MSDNPTLDQMNQMIEAIFVRTDHFLATHGLAQPGDRTGFVELLRLVFDADEAGRAIYASMNDELFDQLWKMYQGRNKGDVAFDVSH